MPTEHTGCLHHMSVATCPVKRMRGTSPLTRSLRIRSKKPKLALRCLVQGHRSPRSLEGVRCHWQRGSSECRPSAANGRNVEVPIHPDEPCLEHGARLLFLESPMVVIGVVLQYLKVGAAFVHSEAKHLVTTLWVLYSIPFRRGGALRRKVVQELFVGLFKVFLVEETHVRRGL